MRHLDVVAKSPCPMDGAPARLGVCRHCAGFVSYRSFPTSPGREAQVIGCANGSDMAAWLRREFAALEHQENAERTRAMGRAAAAFATSFLAGVALDAIAMRRRRA